MASSSHSDKLRFDISKPDQVIELLVSELYAGDPEVSLREVIQNARDANQKFSETPAGVQYQKGHDPFKPLISIWQERNNNNTLFISDNGIGMTLEQIKHQLLDIGVTEKSKRINNPDQVDVLSPRASQGNMIGKYGIGVLGYYILASRVTFYTRSYEAAGSSDAWIKLETEIEDLQAKDSEIPWAEVEALLLPEHPLLMFKKNPPSAHGTIVKLDLRPSYKGPDQFKDQLDQLRNFQTVEDTVARHCFFLDQQVQFLQPSWIKPHTVGAFNVTEYGKVHFTERVRELGEQQGGQNKPLTESYSIIDDNAVMANPAELFLFLRDDGTYEKRGIDIYVDGLLVEPRARDLRPFWASFVHGVVVLHGVSTSLDRKGLPRHNTLFRFLRRQIDDRVVAMMAEFMKNKSETFLRELWPALDGNFIPVLLRAAMTSDLPEEKAPAERALKQLGLFLPVPTIVSGRFGKTTITRQVSLNEIIQAKRSQSEDVGDDDIVTILYIRDSGSAEAVAADQRIGVVDASKMRGGRENHMFGFLTAMQRIRPEALAIREWRAENDLKEFVPPPELEAAWEQVRALLAEVMRFSAAFMEDYKMQYSVIDYKVSLCEYKEELPIVIVHRNVDGDAFAGLKAFLNEKVEGPAVDETLKFLDKKSGQTREYYAFLNASNPVFRRMAEDVREIGSVTPIMRSVAVQLADNARVDQYGGRYFGATGLSQVYGIRNQQMIQLLDLAMVSYTTLRINQESTKQFLDHGFEALSRAQTDGRDHLMKLIEVVRTIASRPLR